jgi:hypothetical protein
MAAMSSSLAVPACSPAEAQWRHNQPPVAHRSTDLEGFGKLVEGLAKRLDELVTGHVQDQVRRRCSNFKIVQIQSDRVHHDIKGVCLLQQQHDHMAVGDDPRRVRRTPAVVGTCSCCSPLGDELMVERKFSPSVRSAGEL